MVSLCIGSSRSTRRSRYFCNHQHASLVLLAISWLSCSAEAEEETKNQTRTPSVISYVVEPFESSALLLQEESNEWYQRTGGTFDELTLTSTTESTGSDFEGTRVLFGSDALEISYLLSSSTGGADDPSSFVEFGKIQQVRPHNCHGATHLSLWYRHDPAMPVRLLDNPESVRLSVSVYDDTGYCNYSVPAESAAEALCSPSRTDLEVHEALKAEIPVTGAAAVAPNARNWQQLRLPLTKLTRRGFDPSRLRGWSIRLEAEESGAKSGVLTVDQLECIGGGDMLGAVFHVDETAFAEGSWARGHAPPGSKTANASSPLSRANWTGDGVMNIEYAIDPSEGWSSVSSSFSHLATGSAYYNLSYGGLHSNNHIAINYRITNAASVRGPATMRFVMLGGDSCTLNSLADCDHSDRPLERHYSFHKILDLEGEDAIGQLQIPLLSSAEPGMPFWLADWNDVDDEGNGELDLSTIKGFIIEFVLDSASGMLEPVRGRVDLSNLTVLGLDEPGGGYFNVDEACVVEPTLQFSVLEATPRYFTKIPFVGNKCCKICAVDRECLYFASDGIDCYVSHSNSSQLLGATDGIGINSAENGFVNHQQFDFSFVTVSHRTTSTFQANFESYWMDDAAKRGSFCDMCDCREDEALVDCRDSNLRTLPKASGDLSWKPRVLDLRRNPGLFLLGGGSLPEIAASLEVLYLPASFRHLSMNLTMELPALVEVRFEQSNIDSNVTNLAHEPDFASLSNAIFEPGGAFGDVCCGRGVHVDLQSPAHGVTFCNMVADAPGIDSTIEPFVHYAGARPFMVVLPTSEFLSEAASSWEACAEYCEIFAAECRYWNYDNRVVEDDPSCHLLVDNGLSQDEVCCNPDHFADENETIPGWIAGVPPQTRHTVEEATVKIRSEAGTTNQLTVSPATAYEAQYELSLGSNPLRGAVWITPRISTTGTGPSIDPATVSIRPQRVVLYDSSMASSMHVSFDWNTSRLVGATTLVIQHDIESCDSAFVSETAEHLVYIQVIGPAATATATAASSNVSVVLPVVTTIVVVVTVCILAFLEFSRRRDDAMWKIRVHELDFPVPAIIVGRGTFGMVLKAEYRGTQVAVKRVIPPQFTVDYDSPTKKSILAAAFGFLSSDVKEPGPAEPIVNKPSKTFLSKSLPSGSGTTVSGSWRPSASVSMSGRQVESFSSLRQNSELMSSSHADDSYSEHLDEQSPRSPAKSISWRKLRADFIVEMRHLSKLRHPCITTVMGAVIDRDVEPMMVMELMHHGSLYDILHNETMPVDDEVVLPILQDISQGLRFLHAADPQVIHGDLKAANILVDDKFRGKVADFGLSNRKARLRDRRGTLLWSVVQSRASAAAGTPYWMAPELLRGETTNTPASDIYSFGIIMFECFSREEPYQGERASMKEILQLVASQEINKRPPVPPDCPPACAELMKECFSSHPSKRPTATDVDTRLHLVEVKPRPTAQHNLTLYDIFPTKVAEALRDGRPVEPEHRDCVTIFFSDIVGFTKISASFSSPSKVADMLGRLYGKFDELSEKHNIFKVETIGDAYMAVTNLVEDQQNDHTKRIALFSIDAIKAANATLIDTEHPELGFVNIRVGFHSGPVVADVVGSRNPRYCLFGDTVNTASRMESNSSSNRIHCSSAAADLLREQCPRLTLISRGTVRIKGKGDMSTFWVADSSVTSRRLTQHRQAILKDIAAAAAAAALDDDDDDEPARHKPTLTGMKEEVSSSFRLTLTDRYGVDFVGTDSHLEVKASSSLSEVNNCADSSAVTTNRPRAGVDRVGPVEIEAVRGGMTARCLACVTIQEGYLRETKRQEERIKQLQEERNELADELKRRDAASPSETRHQGEVTGSSTEFSV